LKGEEGRKKKKRRKTNNEYPAFLFLTHKLVLFPRRKKKLKREKEKEITNDNN